MCNLSTCIILLQFFEIVVVVLIVKKIIAASKITIFEFIIVVINWCNTEKKLWRSFRSFIIEKPSKKNYHNKNNFKEIEKNTTN